MKNLIKIYFACTLTALFALCVLFIINVFLPCYNGLNLSTMIVLLSVCAIGQYQEIKK